MTEPPATVAGLTQALWDTRTTIPRSRKGSVSRADLIETCRASECRVVGVTAPAGYGKTTLLTQWALAEERPVAWVSLDRLDDDPSGLLTLVASSFARVMPGHDHLVSDVRGLGLSVLGRAAPRLASALKATPQPFVLMLDDLHEVRSSDCHDALGVVISGIPPGSQLVAASRAEQPHLPRLRVEGDAVELLAHDLAMDEHGAAQIFKATHVATTPELTAAVTQRTEGWPVGLYLAAVIARDGGEALTVSGADRYVADYLYRELLARLPDEVQHFLRCTAVLDQMCAPLCDALLADPDLGAQAQLHRLESSNLFLIPLDRRRDWYRYHPLFREFLLAELHRVEPEAVMKLHLRAADWYESRGAQAMALEYLLNTTETDRCVRLVTQLVLPTYQAGQMTTVQRWLSALGDAAVENHPPLAVLAAWTGVMSGRAAEAERLLTVVEGASYDVVPEDGTASFASGRAMLRACMCPAGPEQMMADADFALSQEPAWSLWRDTALISSSEAHLLSGDTDTAAARFQETSAVAHAIGNMDAFVLSQGELAVIAMDRGRWDEASECVHAAQTVIEDHRMYDYATSVLAYSAAGRLALHRGDRIDAERQLTRAMRARPVATFALPYAAVRARIQLAKVYQAMGDPGTARHLLREIDDILLRRPHLGSLLDEVGQVRELLKARAKTTGTGASPLTPAELRLLPYLQTHLTIREIGDRLFVSRNTVSSEVGSIYRKLGVSSRNDAVQQATALGLLGG